MILPEVGHKDDSGRSGEKKWSGPLVELRRCLCQMDQAGEEDCWSLLREQELHVAELSMHINHLDLITVNNKKLTKVDQTN